MRRSCPTFSGQIPQDQKIGSVTAEGAYDTRKCHDVIAERGAYAAIPPRKNAKPWKSTTVGALAVVLEPMADTRNDALRAAKYLGRALWRRQSGYHCRSHVETTMHCVKLLGRRLMARDFDRQVAELHVRIAVLNGDTVLRHTRQGSGGISPSGEREALAISRFVQQSCPETHLSAIALAATVLFWL